MKLSRFEITTVIQITGLLVFLNQTKGRHFKSNRHFIFFFLIVTLVLVRSSEYFVDVSLSLSLDEQHASPSGLQVASAPLLRS